LFDVLELALQRQTDAAVAQTELSAESRAELDEMRAALVLESMRSAWQTAVSQLDDARAAFALREAEWREREAALGASVDQLGRTVQQLEKDGTQRAGEKARENWKRSKLIYRDETVERKLKQWS